MTASAVTEVTFVTNSTSLQCWPEPELLKIDGDWRDAVKKSLAKIKPVSGWPKLIEDINALLALAAEGCWQTYLLLVFVHVTLVQ